MNVCKVDASELPNSRWENTGSETPHCIYWILVCRYLFIKMPQVSAALPGLWPLLKGFSSFAYNFYVGVLHDLFWVPCLIFSVDHWEFLCHQLFSSVQFSSVTQSCPTLCDPMNRSTPALLVNHKLPEFTQTHVHWVGDAIQSSHPL